MESFISNTMNMMITFPTPEIAHCITEMIKFMHCFLMLLTIPVILVIKLSYQPTYTTRINTSGSRYEYDGRKNKLEYIISSSLSGVNILSGLDYLKKNANMSGTIANKEIHSIFTEARFQILKNTKIDASIRREYDSQYDTFDTSRIQLNNNSFENIILEEVSEQVIELLLHMNCIALMETLPFLLKNLFHMI